MVLLGCSVVLVSCSTVGRPPENDRSADVQGVELEIEDGAVDAPSPETPIPSPPPVARETESRQLQNVVDVAKKHLGSPYRWGGSSPAGFDCSGFVRYVYAQVGISLPHKAAKQYGHGAPVSRDQLKPGDLVFFDGLRHNGIYVGDGRFIHARGAGKRVSISTLDDKWFSTRWVGARRL